jgi:hypothetical protein
LRILRIIVRNRIGRRGARRRGYRSGNSRRIKINRKVEHRGRGRANRRWGWMDSKTGYKGRGRRGRSISRRLSNILSRSGGGGGSSRRGRG